MENEYDFIEKYYPNYSSSDEIARWNDLQKLIDLEYEEGDSAYWLLVKEFGGDYRRALPLIQQEHIRIQEQIYEQSIQGFIREQNVTNRYMVSAI